MMDLGKVMDRIQQLSTESLAKLLDFVAYLEWQERRGETAEASWSFSFIEAFKRANIYATERPDGMDIKMAVATAGGEQRPSLWAHPPLGGQAVIEYYVPIPDTITRASLRLAIGIRDGAKISEDNLVAFGVRVNGVRVWGRQTNAQSWQSVEIPLKLNRGDMARFQFTTETLGSHEWTWAAWANPELVALSA